MVIFILESIGTLELIILAVLGIVAFFIVISFRRPVSKTQKNMPKTLQSFAKNTFQVKICPTCRRTYSDISLNFCLDDGIPLSSPVTVQAQSEPEEFVTLQANRDPEKTLFLPRVR